MVVHWYYRIRYVRREDAAFAISAHAFDIHSSETHLQMINMATDGRFS
jgi:hypothetical protein